MISEMNEEQIARMGDKMFINRSMLYLAPGLRALSNNVRQITTAQRLVCVGIDDVKYAGPCEGIDNNFFMLYRFDSTGNSTLNAIRELDCYRDDYLFADLLTERLHMVVIAYPIERAIHNFRLNSYSLMYTPDQVDAFYGGHSEASKYYKAAGVILKNDIGISWFESRLEKKLNQFASKKGDEFSRTGGSYGSANYRVSNVDEIELEFPWVPSQEMFNCDIRNRYMHQSYVERGVKNETIKKIKQIQS